MARFFIDGLIMMAFCVAATFFLRFWRRSHDRLFLMFSIAFWLMAVNRLFLSFYTESEAVTAEHRSLLYLVRLVAFVLILIAIIDKNRKVNRAQT